MSAAQNNMMRNYLDEISICFSYVLCGKVWRMWQMPTARSIYESDKYQLKTLVHGI